MPKTRLWMKRLRARMRSMRTPYEGAGPDLRARCAECGGLALACASRCLWAAPVAQPGAATPSAEVAQPRTENEYVPASPQYSPTSPSYCPPSPAREP